MIDSETTKPELREKTPQEKFNDMLEYKARFDGKGGSGYKSHVKQILQMKNADIKKEAVLIMQKKSKLKFAARNFCLYFAMFLERYNAGKQ